MVNALLNGSAFILLILAWRAIRAGDEKRHRRLIGGAVLLSVVFLVSYLVYHFQEGSTPFEGSGLARPVYFVILISHVILAVVNVPLVAFTLHYAIRDKREQHRRLARITMPVWLYVSATDVLVYLMLYQWFAVASDAAS